MKHKVTTTNIVAIVRVAILHCEFFIHDAGTFQDLYLPTKYKTNRFSELILTIQAAHLFVGKGVWDLTVAEVKEMFVQYLEENENES